MLYNIICSFENYLIVYYFINFIQYKTIINKILYYKNNLNNKKSIN